MILFRSSICLNIMQIYSKIEDQIFHVLGEQEKIRIPVVWTEYFCEIGNNASAVE